jgi:tripartite-type tricarboxylate transporter receptor subunit TctC
MLALMASSIPLGSASAAYPDKPIKLIVPVPPGSGVDAVSRAMAQQMSEQMGQQIVLEYRPGAGSVVGSDALAKSPPDGYTMMMAYTAHSTNHLFNAKMPYDPVKDFTPLIYVCYIPTVLLVHPSVPANTVPELIAWMKANPNGKYSYASASVGATAHLCGELLKQTTGADIQFVPFNGNAPALNALLGGHITMMFDIVSTGLAQAKGGKLKALAVTSAKRLAEAPNIPTMTEEGFKNFEVVGWYMMMSPAGVPKDIVTRLNTEADKALKAPAVKDKLGTLGFQVAGGSPEDAQKFLQSEMTRWADVVQKAGLKAQ